jgi:DNA-3-methyladenine glycosylase
MRWALPAIRRRPRRSSRCSRIAIRKWFAPPSGRWRAWDERERAHEPRPFNTANGDLRCGGIAGVVKLTRGFYDRSTLDVARDLLGKVLVHNRRGVRTSGIIVEVEAYIGESDPACHAAPGPTARNAPLYDTPGHAYVYLNYGIHCLVNVVTEAPGSPAAVLIRALDPVEGIAVMRRRRARAGKGRKPRPASEFADHELCRGPGNLTVAMGIALADNRADLLGDRLFIEDRGIDVGLVAWGPRIGIRVGTETPWRAWVAGHAAVSAMPGAPPRRTPQRTGLTEPG